MEVASSPQVCMVNDKLVAVGPGGSRVRVAKA